MRTYSLIYADSSDNANRFIQNYMNFILNSFQ
jgi:hypothetical protein